MAKSVDEGFRTVLGWLSPTATETATAASHRLSIEAKLKADFGMTGFFRSGSFGHHTSVSGFSDVDYFAVIPTLRLKANSYETLNEVRNSLASRFPNTGVIVRSPAVVVPFGSTPAERHEITPADFVLKNADWHNVYDIPDRNKAWMRSSPSAHNGWVNVQNNRLSGKVKPLIRLVKLWNYQRAVSIRSFYLELRTTRYCMDENEIIYSFDFLRVLRLLQAKSLAAMQDPIGISGYISPCTEAWRPEALSRVNTAIIRAEKACEAEYAGKTADAFHCWNLVFNGYFPSYG